MTNTNTDTTKKYSDEYQQKQRVIVGMERNKKETLKVIKDVNVEYKKKLKEIKYEIADFYAKFGKDDVLDYSKITSKLDDKDFNTMIRDWDKFVKKYPDMERYRDIRMNYYKLDRLQGLSNRIALHVAELGKTEEEMLKGTLRGTFKKAFNNITNLFKKQGKVSRDIEPLKDKRIDALIKQKWLDVNNYSDNTWKNKAKLQNYLDKTLITDMATGKTYDEMYKNLAQQMDVSFSDAKRLIHTEMAHVQNMAHLEGIKKADFNGFKIVATLDSRTSSICRGKNGKTEYVKDYQVGVTAPPFHPYCRSTIFGVDKDEEDIKVIDKEATKVNNKDSELILAGVKKGKPMTFEEADGRKANPKNGTDIGYSINCQSCVVTFEARLRGYDVETLPNTKDSVLSKLSGAPRLAWHKKGTKEEVDYIINNRTEAYTPKLYKSYLDEIIEEGTRYTMQFAWKGRGRSGHIISVFKENGELVFYDPQVGKINKGKKVDDYLKMLKYEFTIGGVKVPFHPQLLRIDNLDFNPDIVNHILKASDE